MCEVTAWINLDMPWTAVLNESHRLRVEQPWLIPPHNVMNVKGRIDEAIVSSPSPAAEQAAKMEALQVFAVAKLMGTRELRGKMHNYTLCVAVLSKNFRRCNMGNRMLHATFSLPSTGGPRNCRSNPQCFANKP